MTEETTSTAGPRATTSDARLDLIRNQIVIEISIVASLLEITNAFAVLAFDREIATTMDKAKAHMRRALVLTADLMRKRQDSAAAGEAAVEYRAQRGRGVAA